MFQDQKLQINSVLEHNQLASMQTLDSEMFHLAVTNHIESYKGHT